ncbi:hypothetical protein TSTA_120230 [Talaromyces stipitatus ATCC 10500]|uniref:Uncharacterized protein n=1 Tax=Talaromyces stipitatus (strain ATCC 10500 / CBS 375.48 / QM 6759 / NRRL 1006) TaxID=441959 RepID=B8MDP4_TALSN|nr:uncharacterized protein TSTA_120230 [Talaromyces stipitatus ATCC 10500]EED18273.1 hypothetical protein TSTA_120230 [Talaromyces stipitatus ATCC 10500]
MDNKPELCRTVNAEGSTPSDALEESMDQKRRIHQYVFARAKMYKIGTQDMILDNLLLCSAKRTYPGTTVGSRVVTFEVWLHLWQVSRYLPEHILQGFTVNKWMRIGFRMLWKHHISCLQHNMLPTEANVLLLVRNSKEWPPPLIVAIFSRTGELSLQWQQCSSRKQWIQKKDLPSCQNDQEFGLVNGMCGYKQVSRVQEMTIRGKHIRY